MKKTLAVLILGSALSAASPMEYDFGKVDIPKEENYSKILDLIISREINWIKTWRLTRELELHTNLKIDFNKINYDIKDSPFLENLYLTFGETISANLSLKYNL